MKTLVLILMPLLFFHFQSMGQNRISSWDRDKITNVKIEIQENGEIEKSVFFNKKEQIDKFFQFLESIDFKEYDDGNVKDQHTAEDWTTRFIFRGQRDWVLFWENSATIGKTSFWIDKGLNKKVKKLVEELEKE